MRRTAPLILSALALLVVVWPAASPDHSDGFPISSYPMFASARGSESRFHTAVGVTPTGSDVILEPRTIGGTDEVVHASETVRFAVTDGTTDALCREVADRVTVGAEASEADPSIHEVEIRTDVYDAVAWFAGDTDPVDRVIHSRCRVP